MGNEAAAELPGFPSFVRPDFPKEHGLELGIVDTSPDAMVTEYAWRTCFGHALTVLSAAAS